MVTLPAAGGCGVVAMVSGYWCGAGLFVGGDGRSLLCFTLRMVRYGPSGGPLPPLPWLMVDEPCSPPPVVVPWEPVGPRPVEATEAGRAAIIKMAIIRTTRITMSSFFIHPPFALLLLLLPHTATAAMDWIGRMNHAQ